MPDLGSAAQSKDTGQRYQANKATNTVTAAKAAPLVAMLANTLPNKLAQHA
jgi:hypothetical protein